ncbi:MAG TPA: hypothetical protein VG268_14840, partial [Streptosporangiaceae bacterium]|nr:hypothetical protein [Streptosporangiaceae bacterium]
LMAGLMVGYLATRTIGFPGFHGHWDNVGIVTLAIEAVVIVLLLVDPYVMEKGSARMVGAENAAAQRSFRR